jgi:hypothetical protein
MLLNLSNHPSTAWPQNQLASASRWGDIQDLPFPQIDPSAQQNNIEALAKSYLTKILKLNPAAVHLMGELTFSFALVHLLKSHGFTVLASTTHRTTEVRPDGTKISKFEFVQFRHY